MLRRILKDAHVGQHSEGDAIGALIQKLPATYQPTVRPLISRQAELFGLPESAFRSRDEKVNSNFGPEAEEIDAEVFTFGSCLIALTLYENSRTRRRRNENGEMVITEGKHRSITVAYVVPSVEGPDFSEFETFLAEVWPEIELSERQDPLRRIREIENGNVNTTEIPSPEDLQSAEVLSDKSARKLAIAIKSANGLLTGHAAKQIPPADRPRIDELIEKLISLGLVDTEVVVICRETSAQINRLSSSESFEVLDEVGLKCACGRNLSAEKLEKALSITDFGRLMLDGNRWLSILVLQNLLSLGVPIENIRMEQIYSGEEVDCIAEIYGRIVLFELKDKEFARGNAYSFGAKIGIFQPDFSVVVTTERVGRDAKDHFLARSAGTRKRTFYGRGRDSEAVIFIEGLDNLGTGLEAVISEVTKSALAARLRNALSFANPQPLALLAAWSGMGGVNGPEE